MNRRLDARLETELSDVAQTLHGIIKRSPGIHFRSLGREAGLSSVGQLRHHLDTLRRHGVIVELQDGRFKRFFAAGEHDPRLREGLSRFARRVPRRIAKLLLSRPMNRTEIRRNLNCADSTLGYHLNRMVELGDLQRSRGRNCCVYSLTDPEFVRHLLQQHPAPAVNRPQENLSRNGRNGDAGPDPGRAARPEQEVVASGIPARSGNGDRRHEGPPARRQNPPVPTPRGEGTGGPRATLDPEVAARARLDARARSERERKRRLRDQDRSQVPSWLISA